MRCSFNNSLGKEREQKEDPDLPNKPDAVDAEADVQPEAAAAGDQQQNYASDGEEDHAPEAVADDFEPYEPEPLDAAELQALGAELQAQQQPSDAASVNEQGSDGDEAKAPAASGSLQGGGLAVYPRQRAANYDLDAADEWDIPNDDAFGACDFSLSASISRPILKTVFCLGLSLITRSGIGLRRRARRLRRGSARVQAQGRYGSGRRLL